MLNTLVELCFKWAHGVMVKLHGLWSSSDCMPYLGHLHVVNALVSLGYLECLNNDLNLSHFLPTIDFMHPWPNFLMRLWELVWLSCLWYLVDLCLYAWSLLIELPSFVHYGHRIICLISKTFVDALLMWTWLRLEHAFWVAYLVSLPYPCFGSSCSLFLESCVDDF